MTITHQSQFSTRRIHRSPLKERHRKVKITHRKRRDIARRRARNHSAHNNLFKKTSIISKHPKTTATASKDTRTAAENVWYIRNHSRIAIAPQRSNRCADALMITDALRYAVRNDGANGLNNGLFGWSSIACAKKLRCKYSIAT